MGKALIIKDADFSANAVGQIDIPTEVVDITDLFVLTRGVYMWRTPVTNNNMAGNTYDAPVNISDYILMGYTHIRMTYKAEKWIVKSMASIPSERVPSGPDNVNVYAPDNTGQTWAMESYSAVLNPAYPYLYVGLNSSSPGTGNNLPENPDLSDYLKIELLMA